MTTERDVGPKHVFKMPHCTFQSKLGIETDWQLDNSFTVPPTFHFCVIMRCKIHEHFTNERSLISCFTQSDKPEASFRTKMQFVLRLRWSNSNAQAKNNEVFRGGKRKKASSMFCSSTENRGWWVDFPKHPYLKVRPVMLQ